MRFHIYSVLAAISLAGVGVATLQLIDPDPVAPSPPPTAEKEVMPVNAVLGNQSFRVVHGRSPTPHTPERLRLQTHLAYVEALLRQRDVSHLSTNQRANRGRLLDALHSYWTRARFPRNTEVPGRSPVFMDAEGRLCAVGYLIAESAGRNRAKTIDDTYHLAHIRDIEATLLDRWAEQNGFTRRELALVQPMYCGFGGRDCVIVREGDENASALEITGLSVSVGASLLNGVLLETGVPSIFGGAAGIAGGATSVGVGLSDDAEYPTASAVTGATSVVLGTWSLIAALRDDEASASVVASTEEPRWQVKPTTMTTVRGDTRPGIRASLEF